MIEQDGIMKNYETLKKTINLFLLFNLSISLLTISFYPDHIYKEFEDSTKKMSVLKWTII